MPKYQSQGDSIYVDGILRAVVTKRELMLLAEERKRYNGRGGSRSKTILCYTEGNEMLRMIQGLLGARGERNRKSYCMEEAKGTAEETEALRTTGEDGISRTK